MSTITAPPTWSSPATAGPTRPRLRQLWQVPVFLLGLVAFLGVGAGGIVLHVREAQKVEHRLDTARILLTQPDWALTAVLEQLEPILADKEQHPHHAAAAHHLLGAAYLKLAAEGDKERASELWANARSHLEEAQRLGVPAAEKLKLSYRLGKAWYHTGEKPQRVINLLKDSVAEGADDPAEGYALLTQAYLHAQQPDLNAALEANKKLLQLPEVREEVLAPARLLRGELLLKLGKPADAREVLKYLRPPAPPQLVTQARYLQAKTFQEEGQWAKAAQYWRELLEDRSLPATDVGRYLYQLGLCYRYLDQPEQAGVAWEKAMEQADGEEGRAAALSLAEVRLVSADPPTAVDAFARAVRDLKSADDWPTAVMELTKVREVFERGCAILQATGKHELAMQLAEMYEPLALPGVAQTLFAQSAESAAKEKREQVAKLQDPVAQRLEEDVARALFRQAAVKYAQVAAVVEKPADRGDRLWKSAHCYLQTQDQGQAIPVLERFVQLDQPLDRLSEGWFLLGEARRATGKTSEAMEAYNECIKLKAAGSYAYRARYQIALANIARGNWDEAEKNLAVNLRLTGGDGGPAPEYPDPEAKVQSLFELGNLLFRRRNYHMASFRLEQALGESERPGAGEQNPARATLARYQLAECYRNLAMLESQNLRSPEKITRQAYDHYQEQYRNWLRKAVASYDDLERRLLERQMKAALSRDEEDYLRQASFAAAEALSNLGQYRDAVKRYEPLVARYHHRVESLHALAGIAQCYWREQSMEEARATVERIRGVMRELDDNAFAAPSSTWTRREWEEWLAKVSK